MGQTDIARQFTESFQYASGGLSVSTYSSCIRFIAVMLMIIAVMWSVNHFLNTDERHHEGFLINMGSRLIRLVIGFCVFILCLIVKGS